MKAYKGFNKNLQCNPVGGKIYQYEVGKEYEEDRAEVCTCGFHACENPLDTFSYYAPGDSRYCEVELNDVVCNGAQEDSKVAARKIKIDAEVGILGVIRGAIKFIFEKTESSESTKSTTGYGAHAEVKGENAIAAALGVNSRAKGAVGCWIVCAEWEDATPMSPFYTWRLKEVKATQVDGEKILPDTWYALVNGEFVKVEE